MSSKTAIDAVCPVCRHAGMDLFFQLDHAPVLCNVLWDRREDALAVPRAPIRLGYCPDCSMVCNVAFDGRLVEYSPRYENSLHYSTRFERYVEDLAEELVRRHGLRGKDIVEIGCGQGDFLAMLAKLGDNRAVGYDPGYDPARASRAAEAGVTIFPKACTDYRVVRPADLICCRHVLEHIDQPLGFLRNLRRVLGTRHDTLVFFEVPDALYTLRDMGIWDIIYEHCSYFTPAPLARLFDRAGFDVLDVAERYDDQFLTIEARPRPDGQLRTPIIRPAQSDVAAMVQQFARAHTDKCRQWCDCMAQLAVDGRKAVLWGAGSKGITLLNVMNIPHGRLSHVVDINPHKHGRYVTGTGQQVVPPEFLGDHRPDVVIVMNAIYRTEIERILESLGVHAEIIQA